MPPGIDPDSSSPDTEMFSWQLSHTDVFVQECFQDVHYSGYQNTLENKLLPFHVE